MNKQLQDLAWSVLPKEFKEEVKKLYNHNPGAKPMPENTSRGKSILRDIFGHDNLTSDAEGEEDEMLYVSRKMVQKMYAHYDKICNDPNRPKDYIESVYEYADGLTMALDDLFGSKCLPDNVDSLSQNPPENCDNRNLISTDDNKPIEPQFEVGDKAIYVVSQTTKYGCTVTKVKQNEHSGKYEYDVLFDYGKPGLWVPESDLTPYTEPEEDKAEEIANKAIEPVEKHFDTILKDSFRNERRLNIAAQMASAYISSEGMTDPSLIATIAFQLADALIAEGEKGGVK